MDIGSLESFVLFTELGTFARVAERRCRTTSAISAQMKRLEAEYNTQLFEREGRSVVLTKAGEDLLPFAQYMLDLNHEAKKRLKTQTTPVKLVIGSPSDYVNGFLLSILEHIGSTLKNVRTELLIRPTTELKELWDEGKIDILLYSSFSPTSTGAVVGVVKGVWVCSTRFDYNKDEKWPAVLYDNTCLFHQHAVRGFRERNMDIEILSTTSDSTTLCHLVEKKKVIAAMGDVSMTSNMKIIDDSHLPKLPSVYLMTEVSDRFPSINQKNLAVVLQGIIEKPMGSPFHESEGNALACMR
jgi:DNA-binding transcriptional LysR family regulator